MDTSKNNQTIIVVVLLLALIGLGAYVIYDKSTPKSLDLDKESYESKISKLEQQIEKYEKSETIKEEPVVNESELEQLYSMLDGTYSYGQSLGEGADCSTVTEDQRPYLTVSFKNKTATYQGGQNCGSGYSGSGKYYINDNEVVIVNEECISSLYIEPNNCIAVLSRIEFNNGKLYLKTDTKKYELTK